jgi:uncharacterized membrane protein YfcA
MTPLQLAILTVVFFATSGVSVVTGSTSLITVPILFQFGVDPRIALATNMFALTFMSAGGSLPFLRQQSLGRGRLKILIALTLAGSAIGATLLLIVPERSVPVVVSAAMIGVAIFSTVYRQAGVTESEGSPTFASQVTAYILTFLLGIYGGFFSGGYVTVLTAVYVVFLRLSFLQAMAITKLINIFSSGIATVIFMWRHLVDYHLGLLLAVAMFAGALMGAHMAIRLGNQWLRRIFLAVVWLLGLKTLLYDVLAKSGLFSELRPSTAAPSSI